MSTVLTKSAQSGQRIEVTIADEQFRVTVDGKPAAAGWLQPLNAPKGEVTHHIGGKVGFTQAEAQFLQEAFRLAHPTPLLHQREGLVAMLRGLREEREEAFARGHAGDGSAAHAAARPWDAAIDAATRALEDFDAEHPEVAEQLRAERAERLARAIERD